MKKFYLLGLILLLPIINIGAIEYEFKLNISEKQLLDENIKEFYKEIHKQCNGDIPCINKSINENIVDFTIKRSCHKKEVQEKIDNIANDQRVKDYLILEHYVDRLKSIKKQINNKNL